MKNCTVNSSFEFDLLIINANLNCMDRSLTMIEQGALGIIADSIVWIGKTDEVTHSAKKILDVHGQLVTPGLIDCHTHVVYAGNRSHEFAMRLQGQSYQEIAEAGGGILSTVANVHRASIEELFQSAKQRLKDMMRLGVTTIECKSGYGLDLDNEIKLLKVFKLLSQQLSVRIYPTYLALHALPKDEACADDYVKKVIEDILPAIHECQLAKSVDAYCESFAFNLSQVKAIFLEAKKLGLDIRLHAEQFSDQKGAKLAASLGALSVDHLEYLSVEDCRDLANTVAVLLPGAFYFLKEKQLPPIDALRANQVSIAIATDCNPGTSPFVSLPLMMNMACVLFGLTISEAWLGVTRNAAQALGMYHEIGSLELGKKADIVIWSCDSLNEIIYQPSHNFCQTVIFNGTCISIDNYN